MSLLPKVAKVKKSQWKKGQTGNPKGRPKGIVNRRDAARAAAIAAEGLTPLDFALQVLRDPITYSTRDRQWAAATAMPYVHKKMPIAIEGGDRPLTFVDASKLAELGTGQLEQLATVLAALGVAAAQDGDQDT